MNMRLFIYCVINKHKIARLPAGFNFEETELKVAAASACGWNFKALPYSDNLSGLNGLNRASSLYGYANSTFQTSHFHDND